MNRKNWLSGLLAVSLAVVPTCTSAEENSEIADQYIIIELEPVSVPESDIAENVPEAEQSAEDTVEAESEPETVLFSLQESMDSEEYSITGIIANEPIVAQLLAQTADYQNCNTIALYDFVSHQQTADESYDFNLQIPEDAEIILYQSIDGQLQESTLDAAYTEEEYNRLPLISYQSETNHWLVLYLGASAGVSDSDMEEAAKETESAAESLEGKTEAETEEKPSESEDGKKHSTSATEQETTKPNQPTTKETESTKAPKTQPTAHTHAWVPVTNIVHHDAAYKDVWVQDSAAWDETVVTKEAWDEQTLVSAAWDETVVTKNAWDEPVYEWYSVCNACGHVFQEGEDVNEHMAAGCWSGWHGIQIQTESIHHDAETTVIHHDAVYQTIHHDAETTVVHHEATGHTEKVIDQAAWDETVITGYTCSGCGATKEK